MNSNQGVKKSSASAYLMVVIGLLVSGLGVAITRHGGLGVSPVSSIPNVISIALPQLSFGTWLFLWNCVLVIGQILVLRNKFRPFQLLQIPLSLLFGIFTDLGAVLVSHVPNSFYPVRILLVLMGTLVLGAGISLTMIADVIMNAGEAFVKAIADTLGKPFSSVKTVFDISSVLISVLLSLLLCHGQIVGTREGTILAALLTGSAVKLTLAPLKKLLQR